ncbi:MAG: hypothetical protein ACE5I1_02050 [bacterium]
MDSKKIKNQRLKSESRNSITPEMFREIIKKLTPFASPGEKQLYFSYALYKTGYYQHLKNHTT